MEEELGFALFNRGKNGVSMTSYGACPHGGFGLGFERLILFVTGMQNIRDVIPFARTPKNAEF